MLGTIREKLKGVIAIIIVAVLIIPFALWGVSSYFTGGGEEEGFAEVNGEPLSANEYRELYTRKRNRLKQLLGDQIDFSAPTAEGKSIDALLKEEALDEIINAAVLRQTSFKAGYRVSPVELSNLIRSVPEFQSDDGFDKEKYAEVLRMNNRSAAEFEASVMRDLIVRQIQQGVAATSFITPPLFMQEVARDKQQRTYDYVELDPSRFSPSIEPSHNDLQDYYQKYPHQFKSEARAKVEYVELKASDLSATHKITRDEMVLFYENHIEEYTRPERRKAAHILLTLNHDADQETVEAVMEQARELRKKIDLTETFAAVAQEFSQDPGSAAQGGDLGWVVRDQFDPAVEESVYRLALGEISEPVRSTFGVHLVKTTHIEPIQVKDFAEVELDIKQILRSQWEEEQYYELSELLAGAVFEQPNSLEPAADLIGIKMQQLGWITEEGLEQGLAANPIVLNQIFSENLLNSKQNSEPIELGPDHLVVVRVVEYAPSKLAEFEQVVAEVQAGWEEAESDRRAEAQMQSLLQALAAGADATRIQAEFALELQSVAAQTRSPVGGSDPMRVQKIFSMPAPLGQPEVDWVKTEDSKYIALRLIAVKDGSLEALSDSTQHMQSRELTRTLGTEQFTAYVESVKQTMDIEIKQGALN